MEAFEAFVALTLEAEDFVVSEAVKFPVRRRTKRASYEEYQTHGFEVDLVGARADHLVLATIKSFLGSRGVVADEVTGTSTSESGNARYALLNDPAIRDAVIAEASHRFGFRRDQISLRLYAGRFAGHGSRAHETRIRAWCSDQKVGRGVIEVFGVDEVATAARQIAMTKTYRNNSGSPAVSVGVIMRPGGRVAVGSSRRG